MNFKSQALAVGKPRFKDARLAALAAEQGALAAWQQALGERGAVGAARAVSGDFAVGLEDPQGRVFLAVDRFAVHTLCYRVVDGQLYFARRADELADAEPQIDTQAIFDYLYFHAIPSPRTIYKDVFRLPAGHCAWFEGGRLTVEAYWVASFQEPDASSVSFDDLRDQFRGLLRDAVSTRIDRRKPACFLSGGTDSSTVAGMIQSCGVTASTYSIGFEAEGYDEMAYARLAARHFGAQHHEYYVTPDDLVQAIPAVAGHYDQPFGNSSALPAYYCARMARDDGVSTLLAGDGGDELFGGNSRYAKQRVLGWYGQVPAWARNGLIEAVVERPALQAIPVIRKAASYVEQAKVPMPDRLQMDNLLLRLTPGRVLTPALLAQVNANGPLEQQRQVWVGAVTPSWLNRTLAFDWRYTLAESDLPKVIGTSQLAGVAVAFPMLDDALHDFSLGLPLEYKLKGQKLRWFFKEALRGFLPDEILRKKKQGFGLPFGVWTLRHDGLKRFAVASLASLAERGIVRADFIDALIKVHLHEHAGYYGEMVWILMMLEQWLRQRAPRFKLAA